MKTLLLAAVWLAQSPERVAPEDLDAKFAGKQVVVEARVSSRQPTDDGNWVSVRGARNLRLVVPRALGGPPDEADFEGAVQAAGGQVVLLVAKITRLAGEQQRYDDFAAAAGDDAAAWFRLERWAARRKALYGSEGMGRRTHEAYAQGLAALRKRAANDPAALAALRARVLKEEKLPAFDFEELDHGIARAEFAAGKPADAAALEKFGAELERRLPAAAAPQDSVPPRLAAEYGGAPVETFRDRKAERPRLARHWRNELLGQRLEALRKQGEPPYDLAMLARKLAPEATGLARKWLADYAAAATPRLLDLDAGGAAKLADLLDGELGDAVEARRLRREWLDGRELALKRREAEQRRAAGESGREFARDPKPWLELAETRLAWFKNDAAERERGTQALVEIAGFAPDFAPLERALPPLGYVRRANGAWQLAAAPEIAAAPGKAPRVERLAKGMGVEEVAGLFGAPAKTVRVATAAGVVLQWRFPTADGEVRVTFSGAPDRPRVSKVETLGRTEAAP